MNKKRMRIRRGKGFSKEYREDTIESFKEHLHDWSMGDLVEHIMNNMSDKDIINMCKRREKDEGGDN